MAKCEHCKYFSQYYEKGTMYFYITYYGKCRKKNEVVLRSKKCENFVEKPEPSKCIDFTLEHLDSSLDNIMAIKQILEDKFKPSD